MASLRVTAQNVLEEARDGIAWIAFYKAGRGWKASCFWPDFDEPSGVFSLTEDDKDEIKDILTTDQNAIFVNGYYTNLGATEYMTRESLSAALRWQYDGQFSRLANAF